MASNKGKQPVLIEERISPFNCPSCGSMKEIVKTFGNGKQVLECGNCHIDKEKNTQKALSLLKKHAWQDTTPCPECGSKKRYSIIENGKETIRCAKCDSMG